MKKLITFMMIALIFALACSNNDNDNDDTVHDNLFALFTNPNGTSMVKTEALDYIQSANSTIDLECFLLEDADITNYLVYAKQRGVMVRVVCDYENYVEDAMNSFNRLEENGIAISHDSYGGGSAHNKTMIIDSSIVWTGSTNFTYSGLNSNNNNALVITSRIISLGYLEDFQQMFDGNFQGSKSSNGIETDYVEGSEIEVYFGPTDNPEDMLRELVQNAESTIDLAIYSYTLNYITDDFEAAHRRGVQIRAIFDSLAIEQGFTTKYDDFIRAGIDARKDPAPYAFHHKFMIVDGNILVVSSGNYTMSGVIHNDENFVRIEGGSIIDEYESEFLKWWLETE